MGDLALAMKPVSSLFAGKQKDVYDFKDEQSSDEQNHANTVPAKGIAEIEINSTKDNSDPIQMCSPVAINVKDRDSLADYNLKDSQASHCENSYIVPSCEVKGHAVRQSVADIRMYNLVVHSTLSNYTINVKVEPSDSSLYRELCGADSRTVNISNETHKDDLEHISLKERCETLWPCIHSGSNVFCETSGLYSPNSENSYQSQAKSSGITFTQEKRISMCHSDSPCEEDVTGNGQDISEGISSYLKDNREEQTADIVNDENHTVYTQTLLGESYFGHVPEANAAKIICSSLHDTPPESTIAESPCIVTTPSLTAIDCQVSVSSKAGNVHGIQESNHIGSCRASATEIIEPSVGQKWSHLNTSKWVHGSALTTSPVQVKFESLGEDAGNCFSEVRAAKRSCTSISDSRHSFIGLSSNAVTEAISNAFKWQANVSSGLSTLQGNQESEVAFSYNPSNTEVEAPVMGQNEVHIITEKQLNSSALLLPPLMVKAERLEENADNRLLEANGSKQECTLNPSPDAQGSSKAFNSENNDFSETGKLQENQNNNEICSNVRSITEVKPPVIPQSEAHASADNQLHVSSLSTFPVRIKVEPPKEDANNWFCYVNASKDLCPSASNSTKSSVVRNHCVVTDFSSSRSSNLEGNRESDDTSSHQMFVNEINMPSTVQVEPLLDAKNQLRDPPLTTFPTRVKVEPLEGIPENAEKYFCTSMSDSLGSPVAGNPCTVTEFSTKAIIYHEQVSSAATNLQGHQESNSICSFKTSLDVPVVGLGQMWGNVTNQLPDSALSTSMLKVKVEPIEEILPNSVPGTSSASNFSNITLDFLSKAANQFPGSTSSTSLLEVKVEPCEVFSELIPETSSTTNFSSSTFDFPSSSVALNSCPATILLKTNNQEDIIPKVCSMRQNQENIVCLSQMKLPQTNVPIVGREQYETDAQRLSLNSDFSASLTFENYEPLGERHTDIFPKDAALILSTSNLLRSPIKLESKSSETAAQNLCNNSLDSFPDSDMKVGEIKREFFDELSIDTLDHVSLKERIKILTSRLGSNLKPAKNSKGLKKTRADSLEHGSANSALVKARSSTRRHKRKRTVTDSVETALEEDAPGLLQGLIDKGIDLGEIKLYGSMEDADALDVSSGEDGFEDLETVIMKLFSERPTSLFKFAPLRSGKGSKAVYCLACLMSLIEQTRYLQFRNCAVEWGWCRDLQSFIFVFKKHNRIVLERPEYGYATYFFELVESFPIDWQIKRLVTAMKLASCSRVTLIENKALLVGEDLTEGEARVLEEYGWRPNSGLGSMLNYCDRVVHDRRNERDSSEWRSKIGKLLMDGYDGGRIVMADLPKKVVEYASGQCPEIKMET